MKKEMKIDPRMPGLHLSRLSLLGYDKVLRFLDICVCHEPRENQHFMNMGVCVSMSGNGCRPYGCVVNKRQEFEIVPTPRIAERDRKEAAGEKYKRTVKPAWAIVTVQGILDNDFYIGTLRQGKYTRKKIDGKEVKRDDLDELFADLKASGKQNDVDGQHFYIDLVFCNYILKCFVRIDLKTGDLTHQDIGQMQMYVNYDTRYQMNGGGIIHRQDCSCAPRRAIPWCN